MIDLYREWEIDSAYVGYVATHPDYDGPEDNRIVHAMTFEAIKLEIDWWIEENEYE